MKDRRKSSKDYSIILRKSLLGCSSSYDATKSRSDAKRLYAMDSVEEVTRPLPQNQRQRLSERVDKHAVAKPAEQGSRNRDSFNPLFALPRSCKNGPERGRRADCGSTDARHPVLGPLTAPLLSCN